MILAQVTNNIPSSTVDDIVKVFSDFHVHVDAGTITIALLAISKFAQIAYKHWTTDGTILDKVCKAVGVVNDSTTVVNNTITK